MIEVLLKSDNSEAAAITTNLWIFHAGFAIIGKRLGTIDVSYFKPSQLDIYIENHS